MGLTGRPTLPADKSISHRVAILSAIADGVSEIVGYSDAADPQATLACLRQLGIEFEPSETGLRVHGRGLRGLIGADAALDCGNSATTMRLLTGVLAGQNFESKLIGDKSLSRRPMERVAEPLRRMGARITLDGDHAPIGITGDSLTGIEYSLPVPSAQVKSAILLAGLLAGGETTVIEQVPSRDHTERLLGLATMDLGGTRTVTASPDDAPRPGLWVVPRDFSAAAFFLTGAAILPHAAMEIRAVGLNPTRTALLDVLSAMGASVGIRNLREQRDEPIGDLWVTSDGQALSGIVVEGAMVPNLIDELPLLAVAGAFAEGTTVIRDAVELRHKESDRIAATVEFLTAMGVAVEEREDGMMIEGGRPLQGAQVDSHGDHRIAMAAAIAALGATGDSTIHGADCVEVSFPGFWDQLDALAGLS